MPRLRQLRDDTTEGVTGNKFLSRQSGTVVCARCQISFQDGGETRNLNMALESTSNQAKKDIFKDVRFFLAEENNEEVRFQLLSVQS